MHIPYRVIRKALCTNCNIGHLLDNGRVWAECGLRRLIGSAIKEREVARIIGRLCGVCGRPFEPKQHREKYCSSACAEEMQKRWKRAWWAGHGEEWRQNNLNKANK